MIVGIDFAGLLFQNLVANLADDLGRGLGYAGALHSDGFLVLVVQCLKFGQHFLGSDIPQLNLVADAALILFLGIGGASGIHNVNTLVVVLTVLANGGNVLHLSLIAADTLVNLLTSSLTGGRNVSLVILDFNSELVAQNILNLLFVALQSAANGALLPGVSSLGAGCGGILGLILVFAGSGYVLVCSCTALGADVIVAASLPAGSFHKGVRQDFAFHMVASGDHAIAGIAAQGAGLALDAALVAVSISQDDFLAILVSAGVNRQNLLRFLNGIAIAAAAHQAIAQALVLTGSGVALNDLGVVVAQSGQGCELSRDFLGLGSAAFLAGEQSVLGFCAGRLHGNAVIPHMLASAATQAYKLGLFAASALRNSEAFLIAGGLHISGIILVGLKVFEVVALGLSGLHLVALQSMADGALFPLVASLGAGCVAGLLRIGMLAGSLQNLSNLFLAARAGTLDVTVFNTSRILAVNQVRNSVLRHWNDDILGSLAAGGAGGAANASLLTSCLSQRLGLAVDMLGSVHRDFLVAAEPLSAIGAVGAPNTGGVADLGAGGILLLDSLLVCVVGGIHTIDHLVSGDLSLIFGVAVLADIQFLGILGAGSVYHALVFPCMLAGAANGGYSLYYFLFAAQALVYLLALGLTGRGNVSLVVFNLHSEVVAQGGVIFVRQNFNTLTADSAEDLNISPFGAGCVMNDIVLLVTGLTGGMGQLGDGLGIQLLAADFTYDALQAFLLAGRLLKNGLLAGSVVGLQNDVAHGLTAPLTHSTGQAGLAFLAVGLTQGNTGGGLVGHNRNLLLLHGNLTANGADLAIGQAGFLAGCRIAFDGLLGMLAGCRNSKLTGERLHFLVVAAVSVTYHPDTGGILTVGILNIIGLNQLVSQSGDLNVGEFLVADIAPGDLPTGLGAGSRNTLLFVDDLGMAQRLASGDNLGSLFHTAVLALLSSPGRVLAVGGQVLNFPVMVRPLGDGSLSHFVTYRALFDQQTVGITLGIDGLGLVLHILVILIEQGISHVFSADRAVLPANALFGAGGFAKRLHFDHMLGAVSLVAIDLLGSIAARAAQDGVAIVLAVGFLLFDRVLLVPVMPQSGIFLDVPGLAAALFLAVAVGADVGLVTGVLAVGGHIGTVNNNPLFLGSVTGGGDFTLHVLVTVGAVRRLYASLCTGCFFYRLPMGILMLTIRRDFHFASESGSGQHGDHHHQRQKSSKDFPLHEITSIEI